MRSSRILHSIYGCLTHAYSPYFVSMFSILFSQFRHQCPAWNVNCMRILKRFESFHWITFHQPSWTHFTHWIIHLIYQHFRYQDVVVFSVWEKKETNSRRKSEGAKWRDAGWESPRKTELKFDRRDFRLLLCALLVDWNYTSIYLWRFALLFKSERKLKGVWMARCINQPAIITFVY